MIDLRPDEIFCLQYCVIAVICTLSLIYFIIVTNRSAEHSGELLFYKLTVGFAALCALTDVLFALREYCSVPFGDAVNYTSEILYSLGSICGAYCWFVYSEKKQRHLASSSSGICRLCAIPFAVMCLFTVTTPIHKLCFSLSGSQYVRGVLNIPFTVICTAFVVISGIGALINSFRKQHHSNRVLLRFLFLYSVLLAAAQALQILFGPILPFRSLSATVLFLFVTLRGMCETVTVDALTGINNRFSLNRALDSRILSGEKFWLLMLDIDDFKHINDTYGHINGDRAIALTASAIVRAVPRNCFAARYGGDEFAVITPSDDESVIAKQEENIRGELKKLLQENNCPYTVDITSGYALRSGSTDNIPDLIAAADRILYEKKRAKKSRAAMQTAGFTGSPSR